MAFPNRSFILAMGLWSLCGSFYGDNLRVGNRNLGVFQARVRRGFIALMGKSPFKVASVSAQTTL